MRSSSNGRFVGNVALTVGLTMVTLMGLTIFSVVRRTIGSTVHATKMCNGAHALCDRPFDQVTFAVTHNSYATTDGKWSWYPAQTHDIARQLADGIRGLMLDLHNRDPTLSPWLRDGVYLCHQACRTGDAEPWTNELTVIRTFLETHPREVISLLLESYVTHAEIARDIFASGLGHYLYHPTDGTSRKWPTLGQLIDSGQRLLVFNELNRDPHGSADWDMPLYGDRYTTPPRPGAATETDCCTPPDPSQLTCAHDSHTRGDEQNSLFLLNHFSRFPDPRVTEAYARPGLLLDRARQCTLARHKTVNFVAVNFYELSDVLEVTRALNRLGPQPSQPQPQPRPQPAATSHPDHRI